MIAIRYTITVLLSLVLLSGCLPSKIDEAAVDDVAVAQIAISGNEINIPKPYLARASKVLGSSVYLTVMFPEFSPIIEEPKDLLRQGVWFRNIDIVISKIEAPPSFDDYASEMIRHFKAKKIVGDEYELIHQTQDEGAVKDHMDVWIEKNADGNVFSLIACSEKLQAASIPQCDHYFFVKNLRFKLSYDKRLLPDWKIIRKSTLALFDSLRSEKTAREFLRTALLKSKPFPKGGNYDRNRFDRP